MTLNCKINLYMINVILIGIFAAGQLNAKGKIIKRIPLHSLFKGSKFEPAYGIRQWKNILFFMGDATHTNNSRRVLAAFSLKSNRFIWFKDARKDIIPDIDTEYFIPWPRASNNEKFFNAFATKSKEANRRSNLIYFARFNADTGQIIWKRESKDTGFPLVEYNDLVISEAFGKGMVGLDVRSGKAIWKAEIPPNKPMSKYGTFQYKNLTVHDGKLYAFTGDSETFYAVYAFDAKSGKSLWVKKLETLGIYPKASRFIFHNGNIIFSYATWEAPGLFGKIVSLDQKTGKRNNEFITEGSFVNQHQQGDMLYYANFGRIIKFDMKRWRRVWHYDYMANFNGVKHPDALNIEGGVMVYLNGRVYFDTGLHGDERIHCVDARTGEYLWLQRKINDILLSEPRLYRGKLYYLWYPHYPAKEEMRLTAANPATGRKFWEMKVPGTAGNAPRRASKNSLTIRNGKAYFYSRKVTGNIDRSYLYVVKL